MPVDEQRVVDVPLHDVRAPLGAWGASRAGRKGCEALVAAFAAGHAAFDAQSAQLGLTKVFLRKGAHDAFETARRGAHPHSSSRRAPAPRRVLRSSPHAPGALARAPLEPFTRAPLLLLLGPLPPPGVALGSGAALAEVDLSAESLEGDEAKALLQGCG